MWRRLTKDDGEGEVERRDEGRACHEVDETVQALVARPKTLHPRLELCSPFCAEPTDLIDELDMRRSGLDWI